MLLDSKKTWLISYRADMELRLLILECSHCLSLFVGNKEEWGPLILFNWMRSKKTSISEKVSIASSCSLFVGQNNWVEVVSGSMRSVYFPFLFPGLDSRGGRALFWRKLVSAVHAQAIFSEQDYLTHSEWCKRQRTNLTWSCSPSVVAKERWAALHTATIIPHLSATRTTAIWLALWRWLIFLSTFGCRKKQDSCLGPDSFKWLKLAQTHSRVC